MRKAIISLVLLLAVCEPWFCTDGKPLLLREPTLSKTHIVFAYAGDLWIVGREGGEATRLTTGVGTETTRFSRPTAR